MKFSTLIYIALLFSGMADYAHAENPVLIGWSGPMTGNCAVVGVDSAAAVQLAIDQANAAGGVAGRQLKLVVEDDGYETTQAVGAYKKLVSQNGARLVIANTYGGVFATARDALRDGAMVIDPLDCNDDIAALPENTFCLATRTESITNAFVQDISRNRFKSVLLLVEESDGWMQLVARNTRLSLEKAGVSVKEEFVSPTEGSFRPLLLRARQARVEALIILGNDQMGLAPREMRELGMPAQIYGVGSILSPGFRALAGESIEGARVSSWLAPRTAKYSDFLKTFEEKFGRKPALELATMPSYDVASILIQCLQKTLPGSGEVDTEKMRNCILGQHDFDGLTGSISFDPDGAVRSIHERLYEIRDGQLSGI